MKKALSARAPESSIYRSLTNAWRDLRFLPYGHVLAAFMLVIVYSWYRLSVGVTHGMAPLITWMVMAGTAVVVLIWLTLQVYKTWAAVEADNPEKWEVRMSLALLVLQFVIIFIGNSVVVALMVARGIKWKPADETNLRLGIAATVLFIGIQVVRKLWPNLPIASQLGVSMPWAKCYYTVALKAAPQVLQALSITRGQGRVDLLGISMLLLQGIVRVIQAYLPYKREKSVPRAQRNANAASLWTSARIDLLTMGLVGGATIEALS